MIEIVALIRDILDGGSDIAMIVMGVAVWRLERRVFRLELLRNPEK